MKSIQQRQSLQEIKQIDLISYLFSLGYNAVKNRRDDYWYLSPFREEKTPSFKVNQRLNRWFDFGEGIGGSIIDFGIRYFRCTINEFIRSFDNGSLPLKTHIKQPADIHEDDAGKIIIQDVFPIRSKALEKYITSRAIELDIARQYCQEVVFELYQKKWFAIGFKNDKGGFELRNQFFKGSSSPKAPASLSNQSADLSVFEGFFDFLSYQMITSRMPAVNSDFLILNSLAFAGRLKDSITQYGNIFLYLDQGRAGQNCSADLMSMGKNLKDQSYLYQGFDDLNDGLIKQGVDKLSNKFLSQINVGYRLTSSNHRRKR